MPIQWEGMAEFRRWLAAAPDKALTALSGSIWAEANDIMTRSRPLVPVDQGTLRASGTVNRPNITGTRVTVSFGYGGAASAYAVIQHERMDYHHTVGQAKYLEQPVLEAQRGLESRLGARIGRMLA